MKKIMFFSMLLGLMFVFSSTASAQGVVFKINGSGKMRPLVGEKITFTVHTLNADVPELGLKKGVNVCLIGVFSGGQQATIYLKIDCSKTKIGNNIAKITKVDNPVPEMIKGDIVTLDLPKSAFTISRGNTVFGRTYYKF